MDPSKSPFDDPDFPGKSESATGEPSSATAIFGTVSARPAPPPEDDLLRSLLRNESAPESPIRRIASGNTFSRLPRRSPGLPVPLRYRPVSNVEPPPSTAPGGFTEMFQALGTPASPSRDASESHLRRSERFTSAAKTACLT